jgi:hypothetical protein
VAPRSDSERRAYQERLLQSVEAERERWPNWQLPLLLERDAALLLAGQLQLALRHPKNTGFAAEATRQLIDAIIALFRAKGLHAHAEFAILGDFRVWDS